MGLHTSIQWCDSTVNPTENCRGCELWRPALGIRSCYAGRLTERWRGKGAFDGPMKLHRGRMAAAAAWSDLRGQARPDKPWIPPELPRLIFVSDMSDALSAGVPFDFLEEEVIDQVRSPAGRRHIWIWLTKRPQRMAQFSLWLRARSVTWPDNLWAVTSVTDQETAARRIPWLLEVGDADTVRGISAEPIWGKVRIVEEWARGLDWIIVGGESGRQTDPGTFGRIADLVDQAEDLEIPLFVKQMGTDPAYGDKKGGDWSEWNVGLQVRQFPARKTVSAPPDLASLAPRAKHTEPFLHPVWEFHRTKDAVSEEFGELGWLDAHPHRPKEQPAVRAIVRGFLEWFTVQREKPLSASFREGLLRHLKASGIRHCRRCGCVENFACPGGCSWSEDPELCNRCL